MDVALLKFFSKSSSSLLSAKDTGIGETTTKFSAEQRASIGRYAAEHNNSFAVKKFKSHFEQGLGESTVQLFKKKHVPAFNHLNDV